MRSVPLPLANPRAQQSVQVHLTVARRVYDAPGPMRLWHLASLDAPTVAVTWSLGFARAAGIRLPFWVPVLIALGTWTVYVGDRLLDARASLRSGALHSLHERHYFHWRHRRILVPLATVAASAAAAIIFALMPIGVRERDSVLATATLAYFSGVHSRCSLPARLRAVLSKEFLVGTLFTAGCALPAFSRMYLGSHASAPSWPLFATFTFFAALAWLNCHAIDCWESTPPAYSSIFPLAGILGVAGLMLAVALAAIQTRPAAVLAAGAASALLLALLDRMRARITPLALRVFADVVLLTPMLLIPFALRTP